MRKLHLVLLRRGGGQVARLRSGLFGCGGLCLNASGSVVAHPIHRHVVDHGRVVHVGDVGIADVSHRAVIVKVSITPQ